MEIVSVENSQVSTLPSNDVGRHTEDVGHPTEDVSHHTDDVVLPTEDVVLPTEDVSHNTEDVSHNTEDVIHHTEDADPQLVNHGDAETKCEITEEELGSILEVIAATGKFWHDWDTLKGLLSFRLKQVLAEYPEAQMDHNQQSSSLGETYVELVRRLDEAIFSFIEGPPFTLQRLCEILLAARIVYPNLSKLALALEKNLLVTSTLTISTDPYPSTTVHKHDELDKGSADPLAHSSPLQNGVEPVAGDEDEEMADAEEIAEEFPVEIAEEIPEDIAVDNTNRDKETTEETVDLTSEASSDQNTKSEPSGESSPSSENLNSMS